MRDDQFMRLQGLVEKLTDVVLIDADPANWSGYLVPPVEMTQQQRGDAYWSKKNAFACIGVLMRIDSLVGRIQMRESTGLPVEDATGLLNNELDKEIAAAESQAKSLLDRFQRGHKANA